MKLKESIRRNGLVLAQHAEESALNKLLPSDVKYYGRLHILVIRIDAKGELVDSAPCKHCIGVMSKYGIKKVTYSVRGGSLVTKKLSDVEEHQSVGYRCIERTLEIIDKILQQNIAE